MFALILALAVVTLGLSAAGSAVRAGDAAGWDTVQTRDGSKFTGKVEIRAGQIALRSTAGQDLTIPLTNLLQLDFRKTTLTAQETGGKGNGLLGVYYNTTNLTGPAILRLDETINFEWEAKSSPLPGIKPEYYSIRWMGQVEAPQTDNYTFYLGSDDGGRLWVAGQGPVRLAPHREYTETNLTLPLEAGKKYDLKMEYFAGTGSARAKLWWSRPDLPKMLVPRERLYAASLRPEYKADIQSGQGLLATYYSRPDLTGGSFSRVDPAVDFEWSGSVPAPAAGWREQWLKLTAKIKAGTNALEQFRQAHDLSPGKETEAKARVDRNRRDRAQRQVDELTRKLDQAVSRRKRAEEELARAKQRGRGVPAGEATLERTKKQEAADAEALTAAKKTFEELKAIPAKHEAMMRELASDQTALDAADKRLNEALAAGGKQAAPGIPQAFFSARWLGQVMAEKTEPYSFYVVADEGARLWVNAELVIDRWEQATAGELRATVPLRAGERCDLRLEARNTDDRGVARLLWSSPSVAKSVIPQRLLYPSKPSPGGGGGADENLVLPPGVMLTSGVLIQRPAINADDTAVRFEGALKDYVVPITRVARIQVRPLTRAVVAQLQPGRVGALLNNRDFIEGEFVSLKDGVLRINSVLFGVRKFDVASQISVIVLREAPELNSQFVVKATDGTTVFAPHLALEAGAVAFPEAQGLKIAAMAVAQIKRGEGVKPRP